MKVKNIIVSGGAGFIGSNLCATLVDRGDSVICLDNLITGSEKNIAPLLAKVNFKFVNFDVCKSIDSRMYGTIDEIYHLASPADPNIKSPYSYMAHPFETMEVNTSATWKLCELALKKKAKILFTSTSEVYGDPQKSPQDENYRGNVSTTGPRAIYDEAKRFGETIVSAYVREKRLDGRITRIFNTYGPGMNFHEGRAVVNFINQAIKNDDITIYGDGKQTRSFCYISDQLEGQIFAMEKGQTAGEVFNIGNPDERTILDFAQLIKRLSESTSKIKFTDPMPLDDPMQRKPDITKAKEILGWTPKISLEAGLAATIEYFRKNS